MNMPVTGCPLWLMKIEMKSPSRTAILGTRKDRGLKKTLISWVNRIMTGMAMTASQKFV